MPTELRDRRDGADSAKGKAAAVVVKDAAAKKTGPMDKWVEPALATKASYEDHNGQPFGVLEHMQPLGEPPSSKVKARVKAEQRKSMPGKSAATIQSTAESTPQPQIAAKQEVLPEMEPVPTFSQPEPVVVPRDDSDDDDYAPDGKDKKKKKVKGKQSRVSLVKTEPQHDLATPPPQQTPAVAKTGPAIKTSSAIRTAAKPATSTPSTAKPAANVVPKPVLKSDFASSILRPEHCSDEKIQEIVEDSKQKAIAMGNQQTADHVHALWEDSIKSPTLRVLLVKVLTSTAAPNEVSEFHVFIKSAKRRVEQRKAQGTYVAATPTGPPLPASHLKIIEQNKGTTYNSKGEVLSRPTPQPKPKKTKAQRKLEKRAKEMDENPWPENYETEPDEVVDDGDEGFDPDDYDKRRHYGRWHWTQHPRCHSPPRGIKEHGAPIPQSLEETRDPPKRGAASVKAAPVTAAAAVKPAQTSSTPAKSAAMTTTTARSGPSVRQAVTQTVEDIDTGDDTPAEQALSRPTRGANLAVPPQANNKRTSEEAELDQEIDHEDVYQAKKQKLTEKLVHRYEAKESNERTLLESPGRKTRVSARANGVLEDSRQTRQTRQSLLDDDSDNESALSSAVSHHNTPPPFTLTASSNKRAKTKQSPQKKGGLAANAAAGVGGATASDSPMDVDYSEEASENNDFCSACRGSGYLLCCDGCDRSFHFQCLDPPLDPNDERLNEPWFCFDCVANKRLLGGDDQSDKISHGIFAPLLTDLRKRNPTTFALPLHIQSYYEGVAADDHGNFLNAPRNAGRRRAGFGDPVDLFKMRDAKGNLLFCYHCAQTSQGERQVAQCDECAQVWHLDCLDPPLAIHPCITGDGRKVADWICPLHIEHELKQIDARRLFNDQQGRRLKIRRPKGAKPKETFLSRGARNNGNIEILEVESSDESDDEEFYTQEDPRREGVVLKMPDKGIKLDFIEKIKQDRVQQYRDAVFENQIHGRAQGSRVQIANARRLTDDTEQHSLHQRQAALNLAQFAHADRNVDLGLGSDNIETLLMGLLAEAPSSALGADPDDPKGKRLKLRADEKQDLEALQQLIARRLEALQA